MLQSTLLPPQVLENPSCTVDYANLCKVMSTIKVDVATEEGKPKVVTFRRVLLTKCQQEFEKDKKDDEDREKMLAAIKDTEDVRHFFVVKPLWWFCLKVVSYGLYSTAK